MVVVLVWVLVVVVLRCVGSKKVVARKECRAHGDAGEHHAILGEGARLVGENESDHTQVLQDRRVRGTDRMGERSRVGAPCDRLVTWILSSSGAGGAGVRRGDGESGVVFDRTGVAGASEVEGDAE